MYNGCETESDVGRGAWTTEDVSAVSGPRVCGARRATRPRKAKGPPTPPQRREIQIAEPSPETGPVPRGDHKRQHAVLLLGVCLPVNYRMQPESSMPSCGQRSQLGGAVPRLCHLWCLICADQAPACAMLHAPSQSIQRTARLIGVGLGSQLTLRAQRAPAWSDLTRTPARGSASVWTCTMA